jgi:threonine/homoserine/homoserine lactone efflux protein
MLEVTVIIGGALIAFIALQLWASSGHLKSENAHEDD